MMIQVLLREYCKFPVEMGLVGDAFIDTACLNVPKVRLLSCMTSGVVRWACSGRLSSMAKRRCSRTYLQIA